MKKNVKHIIILVFSGIFLLISLFSLGVSIYVFTGCGGRGCGLATILPDFTIPIFILSLILSFLTFNSNKRWALMSLMFCLVLIAIIMINQFLL